MSMHISCSGFSSDQRNKFNGKISEEKVKMHLKMFKLLKSTLWKILNNLKFGSVTENVCAPEQSSKRIIGWKSCTL